MSDFINIKDLKKWVIEKDLQNETIKGFWENFNKWKEEYSEEFDETFEEGFDPEKLSLHVRQVSLTISNWPDEDHIHIVIRLGFEYEGSMIGEYRMVFDYGTGEVSDDIFNLY
jgi:hypothetical protein